MSTIRSYPYASSHPQEDSWERDSDVHIERALREYEEEQERIRMNPQAAKKALVELKEHLNEDAIEKRYNYSDFATHLKGGKARSDAEQDKFLSICDQHLDSFQYRLDEIPTHNDSDLDELKGRIDMGIKNFRGKVTTATNRASR